MKGLSGEETYELHEQCFAVVHDSLLKKNRKTVRTDLRRSNRRYPSLLGILLMMTFSGSPSCLTGQQ